MITSKCFVKKTKKGNVLKVVREHYLRDDIWCGSALCSSCAQDDPVLDICPVSQSNLCLAPHYIIPDTNVVLHQMDVLEDPTFKNVIILQTVLEEVRHRHSPAYKRLKDLLDNKDCHYFTFTNEFHKDTYVERMPGESANDRNDRAIRVAAKWYQAHLASNRKEKGCVAIVLLTNDRENMEKAEKDNIFAYTFSDYVTSLKNQSFLLDKLAQLPADAGKEGSELMNQGKMIYPEHLPLSQLHAGIKAGKFHEGKFQASRDNYLEGYIFLGDDDSNQILIQGRRNLNRAIQDDIVVVEILEKDLWSTPSDTILVDRSETTDTEDNEEDDGMQSSEASAKVKTGRVVGVLKRCWRPYCGILQSSAIKQAKRHLFVPSEKRIPKIRIETRQAETLCQQRIVVAIDSWPRDSKYPNGHFVRALGKIGEKDIENEVLLLEHDVPHDPFSQAVLACLPQMPWCITEEDEKVREDLRHLTVCSVDPPGCTDIDDALHCRPLDNGNFEVGVHIADVSHFIRPGTAIDKEAASRGTTVYLVDKRIDMVPELLSSNLCSLRGNEDRFAFSCIWELSPDAVTLSTRFCKSIIRSRAALTYAEAQMKIDSASLNDDLTKSLRNLNQLAKILKQRRVDNGALTLASTEVRFSMDSETHDPIDVQEKVLRETNSMVEEFMLLANISVANHIYREFSECAMLRHHPKPPVSSFQPLVKAGMVKGFKINVESGKNLAESLDQAVLTDNPYYNVMLRMVATRCMTQALYFSSGTLDEQEHYHYGLAVPIYTHFTSPIRRYADIIVHRLLAVSINADTTYPDLLDKMKTQKLCNNINVRHRMAQHVGRASVALYTHIFFKNRKVDESGYILFVRRNALQVLLPKFGLEATIFLNAKDGSSTGVKFTYNKEEPSQTGGGVTLRQFDPVVVQISLDASNIQHQKLDIRLVKPVNVNCECTPFLGQLDSGF